MEEFSDEELNKTAAELHMEHNSTDTVEQWVMRAATMCMIVNGTDCPVEYCRYMINVLASFMPPELIVLGTEISLQQMDAINEIEQLEEMFKEEPNG